MHEAGVAQVRIIPATGAEQICSEFIFQKLNYFIKEETKGRVKVVQVEFREHEKNTAIFTSYDDKVEILIESVPAISKSGQWGENEQSEK